jgi:hypothetical protein
VDATEYGEKIAHMEVEVFGKSATRTVAFVPAKVSDNRHIDPGYIFNLGNLRETERKRYLEGDWDLFEGQYFTEWNRDVHVVQPFEIPKGWPRIRAIDYGFAAPFACLWLAFDQDGNAYAYREAYEKQLTATEQAKLIRKLSEGEAIDYTICDPSMFNKTGSGLAIATMYREAGVNVRPAMNARVDGWNRVRDYLRGEPYLRVFSTCTNLLDELPNLVYDKHKTEDVDTTGADHACFPAGTLVTTAQGQVPIESVRIGDQALTRSGWRPVVDAAPMGAKRLVRVTHENGTVRATPDHPFWVVGKGWVRADSLRYGDMLIRCMPHLSPSPSRASSTGATPTLSVGRTGSTSRPGAGILRVDMAGFTRKSGRRTTVRSPRGITSTTRTTIHSTTTSQTSNACLALSISVATADTARLGTTLGRRPLSGTEAKRGGPGTANTARPRGLAVSRRRSSASFAGARTTRSSPTGHASVATTASQPGGERRDSTTNSAFAKGAGRRSPATATPGPRLALGRVVSVSECPGGPTPVFNLTVSEQHEFFANGVLAKNCDALRYGLMSRPRKHQEARPERDPKGYNARIDSILKQRADKGRSDLLW